MNYVNTIITILLINSKKAFKICIDQYMISLTVKGELNEKQQSLISFRKSRIEVGFFFHSSALAILSMFTVKVSTFGNITRVYGTTDTGSVLSGNK